MEDLVNEATYQEVIVSLPTVLKISEDIFGLGDRYDMSGYGGWEILGKFESRLGLMSLLQKI